jgi:antagonist of KipI
MGIKVLKAGINDSIQDGGRHGFAGFGINPSGALDQLAMKTANALVGNHLTDAVIELFFPASSFLFEQDAMIAISGGDFSATIQASNGKLITADINRTIWIKAGSVLSFQHKEHGETACLAVRGGFALDTWMNSYSTQFSIAQGGFHGRRLKKEDIIPFRKKLSHISDDVKIFPWMAALYTWYHAPIFNVINGPEWDWMEPVSQKHFMSETFQVSPQSNRIGSKLEGWPLSKKDEQELVSSGVSFGTIQLLPNGQLIVLMSDHPTTGGYPRIAAVISAHLPKLAQTSAGTDIRFGHTDMATAEKIWMMQQQEIMRLQMAMQMHLANLF